MKVWYILVIIVLLVACTAQPLPPNNSSKDRQDILQEVDAPQKLRAIINSTPQTFFVNWTNGNHTTQNRTMTLIVSAQGTRVDIFEVVDNKNIYTRTLSSDNETITCSKQKEWSCYVLKQPFDTSAAGLLTVDSLDSIKIESARTRSILGLRTQCFLLTDEVGTEEICYSPQGFPVYLQGSIKGKSISWQAENFGEQVSPTFQTPPAVPQPIRDELNNFVAK